MYTFKREFYAEISYTCRTNITNYNFIHRKVETRHHNLYKTEVVLDRATTPYGMLEKTLNKLNNDNVGKIYSIFIKSIDNEYALLYDGIKGKITFIRLNSKSMKL